MIYTDRDFDRLGWHDCHLWGIELAAGDPERGDWTSDLVLDIDFIAEWLCRPDGGARFRVAPATLVFHGVTDLAIALDWGPSAHQEAVHPIAIDAIERAPIAPDAQRVFLDRPYYRWTVRASWPRGGTVALGAHGFTQTLRAAPVETDRQHLTRHERGR